MKSPFSHLPVFLFSRFLILSVAISFLITQPTSAQVVEIPDPNLKGTITETLELPANTPITQQDMEKLHHLDNEKTEKMGITDLTGLEYATNLNAISLNQNEITDLRPLANLIQLEALSAWGNPISDISPLANLIQLHFLDLGGCRVSDITPLANLTKLDWLNLRGNYIEEITVLANLINLKWLRINGNPILDYSPLDELSLNLLERDEICELPYIPIQARLQNRSFPSVFAAFGNIHFSQIRNLAHLSHTERLALHDLNFHLPYFGSFGLRFSDTPQGWKLEGALEKSQEIRDNLLNPNPNMLFFAEVRVRDDFLSRHGENWPHWLRDSDGDLIRDISSKSDIYLMDFTQPTTQDMVVQQAIAIAKCGLYDGIFLDRFVEGVVTLYDDSVHPHKVFYSLAEEQRAKDTILQRIRAAVRDDFLIIANYNREKMHRRAWSINGSFMETLRDNDRGYTRDGIKQIESTLLWLEENLRPPQINCLEGWGIPSESPNSPDNLRWMRVFTTMSLTHSDGYVLYGMENSHQHIWYDFWNADLGRPIEAKAQPYQNIEGLFIREFTNGWAVYNRSGTPQTITLPRVSTGVASNKQDVTHLLPDLDGEIYLRKGKPYDLNHDGVVNVLDLIDISQSFGTTEGDINGDGATNVLDLTLVAQQFNR